MQMAKSHFAMLYQPVGDKISGIVDKLSAKDRSIPLAIREGSAEKFQTIVLDFAGVEVIGPAFADEIFRVFASEHPKIEISTLNANPGTMGMINRALAKRRES